MAQGSGLFGVGFHRREGWAGPVPWFGLPPEGVRGLLGAFQDLGIYEAVVLSTCERLEVYGVGALEAAAAFLRRQAAGRSPAIWIHRAAAAHLFRVAAGLDSTAVGEAEILGQIREALAIARAAGTVGPVLGPLFERALALGRAVRARTAFGRSPLSLALLAVREVHRRFPLEGRSVLVVGAGTMGAQIAHAVRRCRPARLEVLSRTRERACALAEQVGGVAGTLQELRPRLIRADVAFFALAAPQPVLSGADLRAIAAAREGVPLWLMDLGAPPNLGPDDPDLPGIHVIRLEDLQPLRALHQAQLAEAIAQAEAMVDAAVHEWERERHRRAVGPWIAQLRQRVEAIRQQELEWLWPKLGDLTPQQRARIEQFAHRLLQKVLHAPTVGLKRMADDPRALRWFQMLWGLDGDGMERSDDEGDRI